MVFSPELANYSLRNLRMRKARSALTILSIFVGIMSIFIFISFGWGLYNYVEEFRSGGAADKVLVQPKGTGAPGLDNAFNLTDNELKAVKRVAGVQKATGSVFTVAEIERRGEKKFVYIGGYDPKVPIMLEASDVEIIEGRYLNPRETGNVILGYNYQLPDKIFTEPLQLGDSFDIQGEKVKVVGFMSEVGNPQDDSNIYATNELVYELYPERDGTYSMIIAQVDLENIDRIVEDAEKQVRKSKGQEEGKEDFYVQSFDDLIESFAGALNLIIGFVILIALISVVVSAVNTANTMITSVLERTKEIGIIKSIGARNSEILKIFLFESATLGFIAGTIGVLTGYAVTSIAATFLKSIGYGFLRPAYSYTLFLGLIAFATLTGALSGIIPAYRASRINTVDALRYE